MSSLTQFCRAICLIWLALWPAWGRAEESLAERAKKVLATHCHECHGRDGAVEGGFNFVLQTPQLVARKMIVSRDPAHSLLLKRIIDGEMPPEEVRRRPTAEDIDVLKRWIIAGAPDFNAAQPERKFISPLDMAKLIRADLDVANPRSRPELRYFTLTHLLNAGRSADELQSYRNGLSKLTNSLSRGAKVVVPVAIDPDGTIFRIDLRDYRWNADIWEKVTAANPYGLSYSDGDWPECYRLTGSSQPAIRADWFVATASHPPLYHDILQVPKTDDELEKQLQVDVEDNIKREVAVRAGFNGSGVSRNNRMIERHPSAAGYYWKSYDFAGNTDQRNLFAHPLGPLQKTGFVQDGGEIIFSLPNGLQGYMLVNAKGERIDEGPTSIVVDKEAVKKGRSPEVRNGISCMSCHAKGMIVKQDQIRGAVLENRGAYPGGEAETILALYPKSDVLAALFKEDAARFGRAVEACRAPMSDTEPIVTLASLFDQEIDVRLAASECGLQTEPFVAALGRTPELARVLGALRVSGGTVQRQTFVQAFPSIVRDLLVDVAKLGDGSTAPEVLILSPPDTMREILINDYRISFDKGAGNISLRSQLGFLFVPQPPRADDIRLTHLAEAQRDGSLKARSLLPTEKIDYDAVAAMRADTGRIPVLGREPITEIAQALLATDSLFISKPSITAADGRTAAKDLAERGFMVALADDKKPRMFGVRGELLLGSNEGIAYHLYFGKTLTPEPADKVAKDRPASDGERIYMVARASITTELAEAPNEQARGERLNRTNDRLAGWLAQADRNFYVISKETYDKLMPARESLIAATHPADLPGGPAGDAVAPARPPKPE